MYVYKLFLLKYIVIKIAIPITATTIASTTTTILLPNLTIYLPV